MKIKKKSRFIASMVLLGLWLISGYSVALGARVAGEKDVTRSSPQVKPDVKKPVSSRPRPAARKAPQRGAVEPRQQTSQNNVSNEADNQPKESNAANPNPETRYVTIDFDNVDIAIFIKFISELTGKNFVIDKAVKGKVTIISPKKISVEEAYKVFESVLEVHGFTTVPAGGIIKIVPAVAARSKDIETRFRGEAATPEDKIVTQLIPLRYADPNELKKLFAPLISKSSVMVSYLPTGMLIVTDVLSNILRLLKIIEVIDVEGIGEEISVVPLQFAPASEMAKTLNDVFQKRAARAPKGAAVTPTIKIVADERTNVLVILASEDDSKKINRLIEILDRETPKGEGDIHVVYLQNANAEELSKVLAAIPTQGAKVPAKGKAPVISKEVQIVADKSTNSLVITAKKKDFLVLEDVIEKLDVARRMVYIEALLVEVDVNKDFRLGVEWRAADSIGSKDGKDIVAFGSSTSGENVDILGAGGLFLGVFGEGLTIGNIVFPSIAAVVSALETESDIYILFRPQIMTTDNEEAQINVVQNIPYQTRVESTGDITGREFSTFEYRDVGVSLNITPQINQERFVRLKIEQEVSQVIQEEGASELRPKTLRRVAKTTVIVKDGHSIVIGGLIGEPMNQSASMTPCLGNITGLGWLFKTVSKKSEKTNLYFFLTPHIVENPTEATEIYLEKQQELERAKDVSNEGVIKMYERGEFKKPLKGASKDSDDVHLSNLGYQHLQAKEYQKAKEYLEKALKVNPDNPYAILNMGVIYEVEGNRDQAINMYKKVISLNPDAKAGSATDPEKKGQALTDIARDNMERLQKEGK